MLSTIYHPNYRIEKIMLYICCEKLSDLNLDELETDD